MLPTDPIIALSYVNTKLRDGYPDLDALCAAEDISREALEERLASAGYQYDPAQNQFR